jgi:hypothetical protein
VSTTTDLPVRGVARAFQKPVVSAFRRTSHEGLAQKFEGPNDEGW